MKSAAEEGECVIVGRGSAYYLQSRADAFHVFVYAPFEEKVRRLEAGGKSKGEAGAARGDRGSATARRSSSNISAWSGRTGTSFHLMVNSRMGEEAAVETVLDSVATLQKQAASAVSSNS